MITKLQELPHKEGTDPNDWLKVKNNLLLLALAVALYCSKKKLPLLFASIIREGIKGVSTSRTHIEGRAFDISVRGWEEKDILELVKWFKETFKIGAISAKTGEENSVIYEPREYWKEGDKIPSWAKVGDIKKEAHLHFQTAKNKEGFIS